MSNRVYVCGCGHRIRVSAFQIGMEVSCPACKADIRLTELNTQPLDAAAGPQEPPDPHFEWRAVDSPAAAAGDGTSSCVRCGRPFRGDWDKYFSPVGRICHICANLAKDNAAAEAGAAPPEPVVNAREELAAAAALRPAPPPLSDPELPFSERYAGELRIAASVGAALVIGAALYYALFDTSPPAGPPPDPDTYAERAENLSKPLPLALAIALGWVFGLAKSAVPLYIVLALANKLPHDHFIPNAVYIGVLGSILGLFGMVPMCIGSLTEMVLTVYILWDWFDVDWKDIVIWFVLRIPVSLVLAGLHTLSAGLVANMLD